jgi:hypothetical protein
MTEPKELQQSRQAGEGSMLRKKLSLKTASSR